MFTGGLLYLILMPLIYKGVQIAILYDDRHTEGFVKYNLIGLIWYYAIEVVFVFIYYKITKLPVFVENTIGDDSFFMFVFLSCFFIFCHLVILFMCKGEIEADIFHCIVLTVLFALFEFFACMETKDMMDTKTFESMPYEETSTEMIQLEAFSDTHTTTGEIHGGHYYINGNIQDNYEIYYCFLDEKGSLTIRHFTYYEDRCEIYPEENCENPTIEITTLSKSYKDKSSVIHEYEIHIPKNSIGNSAIDMQ